MSFIESIGGISSSDVKKLKIMARSNTMENRYALRAAIILMSIRENTYNEICKSLKVSRHTVSKWRKRFIQKGISGLQDASGRGRPSLYSTLDKAQVLELAYSKIGNNKNLPQRKIAEKLGMSQTTVSRVMAVRNDTESKAYWHGSPYEVEFDLRTLEICGLLLTPAIKVLAIASRPPESANNKSQSFETKKKDKRKESLLAALSLRPFKIPTTSQNLTNFLRKLSAANKGSQLSLIYYSSHLSNNSTISRWLSKHQHIEAAKTDNFEAWEFTITAWFKIMAKEIADNMFWNDKNNLTLEIIKKVETVILQEGYFFAWLS
ncbi:MAG: helix-turn-helix domain containing protein [Lentisphaerae bacterium]|nr:helix-turn-helix domain containing protein [Lentisphaerota bacterium]MCP4099863.1 helix-turn-helix domain containing protein [Lentisphaerota bacterium]